MAKSVIFKLAREAARRAPHALELYQMAHGDKPPERSALLKAGLNFLEPKAGDHTKVIAGVAGQLLGLSGRDLLSIGFGNEPWADFLTHYQALPWGIVVIFGKPGQGKTELAKKSARLWSDRTGWPVEVCGFYPGEEPRGARRISMSRLVARMQKVARYIDQEGLEDDLDDGLTPEDLSRGKKKGDAKRIEPYEFERMKRRIVVVDEASVFFGAMSAAGQQASRAAAKDINNQVRHLESIFVFICQGISEMPPNLQRSAIQIYKYTDEESINKDIKEGQARAIRERWQEVLAGLHAIRYGGVPEPWPKTWDEKVREVMRETAAAHSYYTDDLADLRAWSYAVSHSIGGNGYRGVFPFSPLGEEDEEAGDILEGELVE